MGKVIKTAILAFGMSGQVFHAPFLDANEEFTLYGTLDRHLDRVKKRYPQVKGYASYEAMLADDDLELIVINTPNFTHFDLAKQALLAGKNILIEKPFTCAYNEAVELFELANQVGKQIFVYQNRRFDSGFSAFRDIINAKKLGELIEVHFRFDRFRNHIGPKQFKEQKMAGAGLLFDLGPHLLDQAISLFGKPISFIKTLGFYRENTQVEDYFQIHLTYPNQLQIYLTASMLVTEPREAFVVHGTKGSYRKMHADVQEAQLLKGMGPLDSGYGIEDPADQGHLTLLTEDGSFSKDMITSPKGDYMLLFNAIADTLLREVDFPIKKQEVLWQMQILDSPADQIISL